MDLLTGQLETERMAVPVREKMSLRGAPPAATARRMILRFIRIPFLPHLGGPGSQCRLCTTTPRRNCHYGPLFVSSGPQFFEARRWSSTSRTSRTPFATCPGRGGEAATRPGVVSA